MERRTKPSSCTAACSRLRRWTSLQSTQIGKARVSVSRGPPHCSIAWDSRRFRRFIARRCGSNGVAWSGKPPRKRLKSSKIMASLPKTPMHFGYTLHTFQRNVRHFYIPSGLQMLQSWVQGIARAEAVRVTEKSLSEAFVQIQRQAKPNLGRLASQALRSGEFRTVLPRVFSFNGISKLRFPLADRPGTATNTKAERYKT